MELFQTNPLEVLYQRRCSHIHYCTPDGLEELMSDISREVLRHHPTQIYSFIADYLDALMFTRENARVAFKLVEDIILTGEVVAEILLKINVSYAEANKMARIIQRAFKRFMMLRQHDKPFRERTVLSKIMARTNISFEEASEAAIIIQRAYRRYRMVKAAEIEQKGLNWRLAARNTIQIFNKLKSTNLQREEAATRIKAAYKGYYMRKLLKKLLQEEADKLAEKKLKGPGSNLFRTQTKAAIVIQKAYRSHLQLKHREESAAILIQRQFRKFLKSKVQISMLTQIYETPRAEQKKEPTKEEQEAEDRAARLIQKSFRKHLQSKVRLSTNQVQDTKENEDKKDDTKESQKDIEAEDRAARVIQRSFRKLMQSKSKLTSKSEATREEQETTELNAQEGVTPAETEEESLEKQKELEEEDKAARVLQRNFRKHLQSKLEVPTQKEFSGEGQE